MIMCNMHKKIAHEHVIFVHTNNMIMCYHIGVGRKSPRQHLENLDVPERGADYQRRDETRRATAAVKFRFLPGEKGRAGTEAQPQTAQAGKRYLASALDRGNVEMHHVM
jgi:hypothetical protein